MEALTKDQKALLETGCSGRVEGLVEGEAVHHCPICGELGECQSAADNYHSCKWCGSTWRSTGRPGSELPGDNIQCPSYGSMNLRNR